MGKLQHSREVAVTQFRNLVSLLPLVPLHLPLLELHGAGAGDGAGDGEATVEAAVEAALE